MTGYMVGEQSRSQPEPAAGTRGGNDAYPVVCIKVANGVGLGCCRTKKSEGTCKGAG